MRLDYINMNNIYKGEILNITKFDKGFIFAVKKENDRGVLMVKFYGYDAVNDKFTSIKKNVYLKIKFGFEFEDIAETLGDYVSCDAATLSDGRVMAIYQGGEYYIFNPDGTVYLSSQLTYKGSPASGIVPDGDCIWCVVPDENAIIKYSPSDARIPMRIGGGTSTTFNRPCSITKDENILYVCNHSTKKIRSYDILTNKIKDFMEFDERVFKYVISGKRKFVWLKSGLYEID